MIPFRIRKAPKRKKKPNIKASCQGVPAAATMPALDTRRNEPAEETNKPPLAEKEDGKWWFESSFLGNENDSETEKPENHRHVRLPKVLDDVNVSNLLEIVFHKAGWSLGGANKHDSAASLRPYGTREFADIVYALDHNILPPCLLELLIRRGAFTSTVVNVSVTDHRTTMMAPSANTATPTPYIIAAKVEQEALCSLLALSVKRRARQREREAAEAWVAPEPLPLKVTPPNLHVTAASGTTVAAATTTTTMKTATTVSSTLAASSAVALTSGIAPSGAAASQERLPQQQQQQPPQQRLEPLAAGRKSDDTITNLVHDKSPSGGGNNGGSSSSSSISTAVVVAAVEKMARWTVDRELKRCHAAEAEAAVKWLQVVDQGIVQDEASLIAAEAALLVALHPLAEDDAAWTTFFTADHTVRAEAEAATSTSTHFATAAAASLTAVGASRVSNDGLASSVLSASTTIGDDFTRPQPEALYRLPAATIGGLL